MDGSQARQALASGDLEVEGRLWDSSNSAVRVLCTSGEGVLRAVYKPLRGERPLWDFPAGTLGRREVATAEVDAALGWGIVPATAWRDEGPLGPGSIQAWVDADETRPPVAIVDAAQATGTWHVVAEGEGSHGDHVCLVHEDSPDLRRVAILDVLVNNADRKGGHVLRDGSGAVMGIDHGLTFHIEPKLRTVLWGWAGEPLDVVNVADLIRLADGWADLADRLAPLLSSGEIRGARRRLEGLIASAHYPHSDGVWPSLPWPAM